MTSPVNTSFSRSLIDRIPFKLIFYSLEETHIVVAVGSGHGELLLEHGVVAVLHVLPPVADRLIQHVVNERHKLIDTVPVLITQCELPPHREGSQACQRS